MGLISLKPEQKVRLRQLLETTPQPWIAPARANPGGRGRIPALVRCTSATAAGGAEPGGTQCYPAVVVNINSLVSTQEDGAAVWLTVLDTGTAGVLVPVDEKVYYGLFAGNFDPFPSGATDPRPRVFATTGGETSISHDISFMDTLGYAITADNTWQEIGLSLTLPSAGTYFVFGRLAFYGQLSALGSEPAILARVSGVPSASQGESQVVGVKPFSTGVRHFGFATLAFYVEATGVTNMEVEAIRINAGGTWTTSAIGIPGSTSDGSSLSYIRLA